LLVGREGDRIVHADGVPIGMFSELRLEPVRLVLQPGEMLLVYTDGLLERQGAVLNEQAVLDAVHAQQQASLDAMLEQVVAEIGAEFPARDDVAAVALRVRPPS
jgi:serine phosphatase RsbU (regulator of sigma subunit)